jgi:membrane protease YdiL (CAAX protease family)
MRFPAWLAAAAGVAVVWVLTSPVPWPGRAMTSIIVGAVPVLAVAQLRVLQDPRELPRMAAYASTIVTLWLLAGLSALAARLSGYVRTDLFLSVIGAWPTLAWAGGMIAGAVVMTLLLRRFGLQESALVLHLLPQSRTERIAFAGLSLTAGITEEFVFRGFLLAALLTATGSLPISVAIATIVFGWAHAYQQPGGAVRAATLGALLALPPVLAGSVVPSMIAHTCIDLIGGLVLRNRGQPGMACLLHDPSGKEADSHRTQGA